MKYSKEQILAAYKKLPEPAREVFMAPETSELVWGIAKKYNLNDQETSDFVDLVSQSALGLQPVSSFTNNLSIIFRFDSQKAKTINDEVQNSVLVKIRGATKESTYLNNIKPLVTELVQKYNLSENQRLGFEKEIENVISGKTQLRDFRLNIVQKLDVTYDQALKIAFDANAQIFGAVMNELRQVQEGKIETTPPLTAEVFTPTESKPEPIRPEPVNPFIPNPSKAGVVKKGPETNPDHMLMDHKETERVDGVHLHSQNVMPHQTNKTSTHIGGSIVDQKLSRIFRSSTNTSQPSRPRDGIDPYREPIE